jgi:hypothetical protein
MSRDASSLASRGFIAVSGPFKLKTAFHAFKLHAKVAFPFFLSFRESLLPERALGSVYSFARFLHSSSFEPSEKGFVREPFIFPRVSRPDASGSASHWWDLFRGMPRDASERDITNKELNSEQDEIDR